MVAISHLTGHQDIYDVVRRAVRDELAQIQAEKRKRKAEIPPKPRAAGTQTPQERLHYILRCAKRYTRETRFDPAVARAGWMIHSKALKLSGMTASDFAQTMDALISTGQARVVTTTELEAIGVFKARRVYCAMKVDQPHPVPFSSIWLKESKTL